jgi:hypothetical protein
MPLPSPNPWYEIVMPQLRAGLMTAVEAAHLADVSRQRIAQWCHAAGFDPLQARLQWWIGVYARGILHINRKAKVKTTAKMATAMLAKTRAKKPRQTADKQVTSAELAGDIINFEKAGGKIKLIPKGKRNYPKPL